MENMDLVAKYEKIAAESAGTAAKKMEAYTSGVEAAQKRLTASLEKWALMLNSSGVLEGVYNGLAAVADNLTLFGVALLSVAAIVGKGTLLSGVVGGAGKVAGFLGNMGQVFSGTANQNADANYAKSAWHRMWSETTVGMDSVAGEIYSSALNRAAAALTDEEKATYKIVQSTFLAQESTDRKRIAEELLSGNITNETIALLDDTTKTKLIAGLKDENRAALEAQYDAMWKDIVTLKNLAAQYGDEQGASEAYEQAKRAALEKLNMTDAEYQNALKQYEAREKDFLARRALNGNNVGPNRKRTLDQMGQNMGRSAETTGLGMTLSGVGSMIGVLAGGRIGSTLGKAVGGTGGQTIGMTLGSALNAKTFATIGEKFGNAISKEGAKGIITGAKAAWASVGPQIVVFVAAAIAAGIVKGINKQKEALKESYNEAAEAYSNSLSSSANTVEYDKLAKGVDFLGRNVSLTSEEYQQFLDLSNKLAEAFPELVVRTDEYGNKLIGPDGLSGKVGEVTDSVNKMVASLKEASTIQFFENDTGGFFSGFNNWMHKFFSEGHSDLSVFGQEFEATIENIQEAERKLGTNNDTNGILQQIEVKEAQLSNLKEGTEEYNKLKNEITDLKTQQEAYQKVISDSKQQVLEYTDALIDYAATADGIVDVGYKFSGLSSEIKAMDDDEQTFINAMVKIRGEDVEYTNMDEFKTQILSISQQMTELVKDNPIIVDLYYGTGEFTTVGASDEAKKKIMKQLVESLLDENGELSDDAKTFLITMGYKINPEFKGVESVSVASSTDKLLEAMGLDSNSVGKRISEEFTNAVNGMTQDQYERAFNLAQNGWLGYNALSNPQAMMNIVNGEYYTGKDLSIRTEESKRIEARSAMDENGETALTRRLRKTLSSGARWDNKETIAQEFSEYGEEVWNQILNLQGELDDAGKLYGKEWQDALDTGLEEVSLSEFKDKLEYDSQSIAYELEGLFTGIDFGEDGIINTFSELKEDLESVDEIFDQIASAREEQNASGQLSLETTLELLAANEDYINALSFEGDAITLKTDAEEIMARVRLQAVQASIQATIAEKKNTLATLQNQYQQLKTSGTYQEVANATVTAANTKVKALQTESDALINEANNLEYVTRWWALYNQAKMGSITPEQYSKAKGEIQFGNQTARQFTKTVETTQVTLDAKQTQEKLNSLQSEIDKLSGGMTYDIDENGNWTWKGKTHIGDDGQLHFDEGEIATWEHLGYKIQDMLDSGKLTQSKWKKAYTNPIKNAGKAAKDTKDKVLDLLKAYDSLIDKEWEAMKVFDENALTPTGYTQYFEKKRASLEKLAAYYEGMMQNTNLTEEERLDAEKNYIENQKAINNLDDEEVEDKYKILELYGASINSLILMKQQLVKTSDTYEELLENQKDLNSLLQDEIDLRKEVSEWQQKLSDRELDYVKGSAWSNSSAYDAAMNASLAEIDKQIEAVKASIQFNFSQAVYGYMTEGMSEMEARAYVAFGNSDYSKAYREAQQEYLDLIDSKTEYVVNRTSAQIEELSNKLQLLEDSKPQEWIRISDIESYYASRSTLLQNQVSVYQKALEDVSDLTDEQIKDLVDGLNEATVALHEAKINALEDKTELQEKQYDAIVYRINLYKDELQDAIDAIEQAYEDEIKPLEDANKERERAIELENLLLAKKNANKEKERVYRQGIGWVFESNPTKLKEAQKDLDNFYKQDRLDDLNNTKDAEQQILQDRIDAWDKYLEQLEWDYKEYERLENERILKELMNANSEEEIRARITADMQKFNSNVQQNYKNYTTIFQDNLLTPYRQANEQLAELRRQRLELLDTSDFYNKNNNQNGYIEEDDLNTYDFSDLDMREDYHAKMMASRSETEFNKWAAYRAEKARRQNIDISGNGIGYDGAGKAYRIKSNSEIYQEWLAQQGKSSSSNSTPNRVTSSSSNSSSSSNRNNSSNSSSASKKNTSTIVKPSQGGSVSSSSYGGSDIGKAMLNAKTSEEFWRLADQRTAKINQAKANKIDTSGWPTNQQLYDQWLKLHPNTNKSGFTVTPYASGIEEGPVTYTGLAMLHGTPSKPEYVLNSDQAYNLLRNMATTRLPEMERTGTDNNCGTQYIVQGDVVLEGVNDPAKFWSGVTTAMGSRWNVTRKTRG